MAILLTGGAGFIGSHTAVACLNAGVEVVLADNFSNSSPKVLDRIEKITGKRPALYNVDVCDKQALRGIFAEQSITGVVHFAGLKAVGESVRLPLLLLQYNPSVFLLFFHFSSFIVTAGQDHFSADFPFSLATT